MIRPVRTKEKTELAGRTLSTSRSITFYCHAPNAKAVFLVGDFNEWDPETTPMERTSEGEWSVTMDLPSGEYEYKVVIDGRWCGEPAYATFEVVNKPSGHEPY